MHNFIKNVINKPELIKVIDAIVLSYMEWKFKAEHPIEAREKFLDLLMGLSVTVRLIDKSMPSLVKTVRKDEKLTLMLSGLYSLNEHLQKALDPEIIDLAMLEVRTLWEDYPDKETKVINK